MLAGPDATGLHKVPKAVTPNGYVIDGSSTDRSTWMDFGTACGWAAHYGLGVGYVCAADDPFTVIDVDVKNRFNAPNNPEKWTPVEVMNGYWHFATQVACSYTESSISGQGLHIWVRGKIGRGVKRQGLELYSQERFVVCTGNAVLPWPVADKEALVLQMAAAFRAAQGASAVIDLDEIDQPELHTDDEILRRAEVAFNSNKYAALYEGHWQECGYPSQSEADMALMSMFTFYSRNNEQCRRLFRSSALGRRAKASANDRYLNLTLGIIRARQANEYAEEAKMLASRAAIFAQFTAAAHQQQPVHPGGATGAPAVLPPLPAQGVGLGAGTQAALAAVALPGVAPAPAGTPLPWPPGLAGQVAWYIYNSAPRPVREVAIVAAVGLLAGICGKHWNIGTSGLNIYMVLIARSGVGKEAMHSGIASLIHAVRQRVPGVQNFVDFTQYVSGPALVKACGQNSSFLNVSGEWGRRLRAIAADKEGHASSLRTAMTDLYQKSGATSLVGGMGYSNKDNSTATVSGVAYSMIGETTPDTLYNCLTEDMMADGFLSRFTLVEYTGERQPGNPHAGFAPGPELIEALCQLVVQSVTLKDRGQGAAQVGVDVQAQAMLAEFDRYCDAQINSSQDEAWRQMWTRAHLKVLRLAANIAIGCNCYNPVITEECAAWAMDVIQRDIALMRRKIDQGDIGVGDDSRERKMKAVLKDFLTQHFAEPNGYHISNAAALQAKGYVPRKYIHIRCSRLACFTAHKLGATRAVDDTIRSLIDSGYLQEMDKKRIAEEYGANGRVFAVMTRVD